MFKAFKQSGNVPAFGFESCCVDYDLHSKESPVIKIIVVRVSGMT